MSEERCPHCRQLLPREPVMEATVERKYVDVPEDWFKNTCFVLRQHPKCDQKFHGALEDLPKALERWKRLTEKQYKLFCYIHKEVSGDWPRRPEAMPGPDEGIPF